MDWPKKGPNMIRARSSYIGCIFYCLLQFESLVKCNMHPKSTAANFVLQKMVHQEPQKPMKMSYLQKTPCFLGKHDVFGKHRIFDFKQFPIHSFNSSSVLKRSQKHHLNLRISHRPPLLHSQRNQLRIRHSSFATPT